MSLTPRELNLPLAWGNLAGLHWQRPGQPRVLCLHGWLDNAASFVPLSRHLQDCDVVALDFAGHGKSSHRPPAARYYFSEYLYDLDAALDALGWDRCNIIGHSMGGGIACHLAAALPERVERLVLLDAVGSLANPPGQTAHRLRESCLSVRKQGRASSRLRPYPSVAAAMHARRRDSDLSEQAARLLCERSLRHTGSHYQWCTDPRLNWRSPVLMTDDQVLDLLAAIRAPVLAITSVKVLDYLGEETMHRRLAAISDCRHVAVGGHHHFHMEQPETIEGLVSGFLHARGHAHDDT